jgi:phosphoribosylformylglycinamidine synthase
MAWGPDGEILYLLGDTGEDFAGSEWAHVMHGHLGGMPPRADLAREKLLGEILIAGSRDGMLTAAHDIADGGIAQALVEMALRSGVGARVWAPDGVEAATFLWSESPGRAIVVVPRSEEMRFTAMCAARGLPAHRIGAVDSGLGGDVGHSGEQVLQFGDVVLTLDELRDAHESTFPSYFGPALTI